MSPHRRADRRAIPARGSGPSLRSRLLLPPALLSLFALACAAPAELARRSESALALGHDRSAFEWAERAMRADPDLPRARAAMAAAAVPVSADWQSRVRALAAADTVAGARLSLEFAEVRARLGGWGIPAPLDSAYLGDESAIRGAAARQLYERGLELQGAGRPREAYRSFTESGQIVPGFRDAGDRARRSFELGLSRIAVLPFEDDTGVPGLAPELAAHLHAGLAGALPPKRYPFVRLVAADEAGARARLEGRLTRETAIRIGRALGATRVVWGHLYGLRSDTDTETWNDRVFRKVTERDAENGTRVRWEEVLFETVRRERSVSVEWSFEVIETDEETALARREGSERVTARALFTRFSAAGDCDDYAFAPPEWKSGDGRRWKQAEQQWREGHGEWTVPEFLSAARARPRYRRTERETWLNGSRPPVTEDLPPAGEFAFVALRALTGPVAEAVKGLEREPAP